MAVTGCDLVRSEVSKYDWDQSVMMAIAYAESSCNPEAVGDGGLVYWSNGRKYGYSIGSLQIRILEGREACDTYDVATNVACAYRVYTSQGFNAWSVYTNGKYLDFI